MRLPRNFVDSPLATGRRVQLPERVHRHLQQVLRLKPGDLVVLFNGKDGRDYQARLVRIDRRGAEAEILAAGAEERRPPLELHLALGISRGERMDWALQKAVELGVSGIQPLFTLRTQVRLQGSRLEKRLAHWRGVILSACEQSGRRLLPCLEPPRKLDSWLQQATGTVLLLDPRATETLPELPSPGARVTFLVGPEGGLDDEERRRAYACGCIGVRLGPRILRTETAPLAALAAAQALWGDFR